MEVVALVVASILLSAGTYLFDFFSNLVVLVEYSTLFLHYSRRERENRCDAGCRDQTSELTGYFYGLLGILVCCHTINALVFKLKYPRREAPLFAAYFLPFIHLWRLYKLLWRTESWEGVQSLRSLEMNGLYCILGSALEGVPMLILQFCGYVVLTGVKVFAQGMSITFKISVAASLLSAAYNGATSVESRAKNATTFRHRIAVGVIAGVFTLCSSVARCLTFTNIIVNIRKYFSRHRSVREQAKFHASDSIPPLFIAGNVIVYWLYYSFLQSPKTFSKRRRDPHLLLTSLAFSYMSMILGPLYPMVSEANDRDQLGLSIFHLKLLIVSLMHLLVDLGVLFVTFWLGTLPRSYMITSLLAAAGYLVSIFVYIKFDTICGLKSTSIMSFGDDSGLTTCAPAPTLQESVQGQRDSAQGLQIQASEDRLSTSEGQISPGMQTNATANPHVDLAETHNSILPLPSIPLELETDASKEMGPCSVERNSALPK